MGIFDIFTSNSRNGRALKPSYNIDGQEYVVSLSNEASYLPTEVDLMSLPTVAQGINTISSDVSVLPVNKYQRTNEGRIRVRSGLASRINRNPNDYETAQQFWSRVVLEAVTYQSFILIDGEQLKRLPFGQVDPYWFPDGSCVYVEYLSPAECDAKNKDRGKRWVKQFYSYRDVLHIRRNDMRDGRVISLPERFCRTFALAASLNVYETNWLNRGGAKIGYLSTDQPMSNDKKSENIKWFKKLFSRNASRDLTGNSPDFQLSVLDGGLKFNSLILTPQEMQLLENKKDLRRDIAAMLNLPLWKLGVLEDYHYSTAEVAQLDYLKTSLEPILLQIEQELNTKTLLPVEQEVFYWEFNREKAITIDSNTLSTIIDRDIKNGTSSINEGRERRNLSHVPGGDIRQIPTNVDSAVYKEQKEILNVALQSLEYKKLQQDIQQQQQATSVQTAALPTLPAPSEPTDEPPAVDAQLASMASLQARMVDRLTADPSQFGEVLRSITDDVWTSLTASEPTSSYRAWADKFVGKTREYTEGKAIVPAYEVNRAINASTSAALKKLHGVRCKVRWVGGPEVIVTTVGERVDGCQHPPVNADDINRFIVMGE